MTTLLRLATALALACTSLLGLSLSATAAGASCTTASGVDVVVDYGDLGGGVARGCAPDGAGKTGDKVFDVAGYPLQYVPGQPGFVCAVAHHPDRCAMPGSGDPWWGLFFSNGRSGSWKMAPVAVTALKAPRGGAVAMVWETGKKVAKPSVAAPRAADRTGSAQGQASVKPTAAQDQPKDGPKDAGDGGGVPAWVPIIVVLVLVAGGGLVLMRRRGVAS